MEVCDLEYVAGLVKGDGSLYYNEKAREYVIEIYDMDIEFIAIIASILKCCGYNLHVKSYETYYRIRVNSKKLYITLDSLIKYLLEKPSISFVRGLLDADGTLYYDHRKRNPLPVVELANKDKFVVTATSKVLTTLNIRHSIKTYRKTGRKPLYKIVLRGRNAIKSVLIIKPLHPVKFGFSNP